MKSRKSNNETETELNEDGDRGIFARTIDGI